MGAFETVSALSDLLATQPMSARQAAARAEELGIPLRYGTIAGYWAGRHGRPSARTLKMLSDVVGISEGELQQAAWDRRAPLGPYVPTSESVHLNDRQRQALDELIRAMVETGASSPDESEVATPRTALRLGAARITKELQVKDGDKRGEKSG
jgi:transcriptional regulator with XRE-family HTH domain